MRRINHPGKHLFTICRFHPTTFHLTDCQLIIDMLVLCCQLGYFIIISQIDRIDFISHAQRMALHDQLMFTQQSHTGIIVHSGSKRRDFIAIRQIDLIYLGLTMPYPRKVKSLCICTPNEPVYVGIKILAGEYLFTCFQVHDHQAVLV